MISRVKHGRGVISAADANEHDVLFREPCLLFGQDPASFQQNARCSVCSRSVARCGGGCSRHDDAAFLPELLDPRVLIAARILEGKLVMPHWMSFCVLRSYTDFPDHDTAVVGVLDRICCARQLPRDAPLNALLGMLRSVCLDVDAVNPELASADLSEKQLTRLWLALGEVPTQADLALVAHSGRRRLPPVRGVALCALGSMVNHSCKPNAEFWWEVDECTDKLILEATALEPIVRGQEITVSYDADTARLASHFGFECTCSVHSRRWGN